MNYYLAGRFTGQSRLRAMRDQMAQAFLGWTCTASWLDSKESNYPVTKSQAEAYADRDFKEIDSCEMLILDTLDDSNTGGREVELGYAMAKGVYCIIVGPRRNVFHYVPREHYENWDAFFAVWGSVWTGPLP